MKEYTYLGMSNLTLLFEQIINTENEFQHKNNLLKKLSSSLQSTQKDLKQTKNHVTSLIGENIIRSNQLGFELGLLMGNENQYRILIEQKKLLDAGHDILINEITVVNAELTNLQTGFIIKSKVFTSQINKGIYANKPKQTDLEMNEIRYSMEKGRSILNEMEMKEAGIIQLEEQIAIFEKQNMLLARQIELSSNNADKLDDLMIENEMEREEVDEKHLQSEFQGVQQKLEQLHNMNSKKQKQIEELDNEIQYLKKVKHQDELHKHHVFHKRQLIQQTRVGNITQFYNPYVDNSDSVLSCNVLPTSEEDLSIKPNNFVEVDEQVDWSEISDFEELD